jgi:hypothetical protein
MGKFKFWLLTEDIANDLDVMGNLFYPTTAGDYMYAVSEPIEHWWLQWKWNEAKHKLGRKFYNIDTEDFEKRDYVAIQSEDMPDAGDGFWKHRPDKDKPAISVKRHCDLMLKIGKNSKNIKKLDGVLMKVFVKPLEDIFKDKPSGKWPSAASNKRWDKVRRSA